MRAQDFAGRFASRGRLLAALMAVGLLAACSDKTSTSESTTGGQTTRAQALAQLTGTVVSTNGVPLEGVEVGVAGQTAVTNASGQWILRDVPVVNVVGGESREGTVGRPLTVIYRDTGNVMARLGGEDRPVSVLGGGTLVLPAAQVFSSSNVNDTPEADGQENPQLIWFDGLVAEAGLQALPILSATFRGNFRNANTGEPITGVDLALDFVTVSGNPSGADEADGSPTFGANFQQVSFRTTTDDEGAFRFIGLPENSELNLTIEGWRIDAEANDSCNAQAEDIGSGELANSNQDTVCIISTGNENQAVDAVNFLARPVSDPGDTTPPQLRSVTGVFNDRPFNQDGSVRTDDNESEGELERGINQSFTFEFTEALPFLSRDSVIALIPDERALPLASENAVILSGNRVTVNLADPVPENTALRFLFLIPDARDAAGNIVVEGAPDGGFVGFDTIRDLPSFGEALAVDLRSFGGPQVGADAVDLAQERDDPRRDGTGNDAPVNQSRSPAFSDVCDDSGFTEECRNGDTLAKALFDTRAPGDRIIQQSNNDDPSVEGALEALAQAFGEELEVEPNVARVEFVPSEDFDSYRVTFRPEGQPEIAVDLLDSEFRGGEYRRVQVDGGFEFVITRTVRDGQPRNVLILDRDPAVAVLTVAVAVLDDLGLPGAESTVTLRDNVPPTVALSRSYEDLHSHVSEPGSPSVGDTVTLGGCTVAARDTGAGADFVHSGVVVTGASGGVGDGGENVAPPEPGSAGAVCLGVAPELLVPLSNRVSTVNGNVSGGSVEGNPFLAHAPLVARRDSDAPSVSDVPEIRVAYDAEAFATWTPAERATELGVPFSEPLASAGTPTFNGVTSLSTDGVLNGTVDAQTINDQPRTPLVENLVRLEVGDTLQLANADHGQLMGFAGVATDTAGNAAESDARARVRDLWAPYVVRAARTEEGGLEIEFNESVTVRNNDIVTFTNGTDTFAVRFRSGEFTRSADGRTLSLTAAQLEDQTFVFDPGLGNADDACLRGGIVPGTVAFNSVFSGMDLRFDGENHSLMDWRRIGDRFGNRWCHYDRSFASATPFTDDVPVFIVADELGIFEVNRAAPDFREGATSFSFQLLANHPVANWFDESVPGANDSVFDATMPNCSANTDDSVDCTGVFVTNTVRYTPDGGGNCAISAASSLATVSADQRTLTYSIVCGSGAVAQGDIVEIDDVMGGDFLGNPAISRFTGEGQAVTGGFTAGN